jgi:hypothetical protein
VASVNLKQHRIFDSAVQCMYSGVLCGATAACTLLRCVYDSALCRAVFEGSVLDCCSFWIVNSGLPGYVDCCPLFIISTPGVPRC